MTEDKAKIEQLVAENNLTALTAFQQVVQAKMPLYQARKNVKQQAIQKFSEMSPSEVSVLPQEEKLKYMELLFPHIQKKSDLIETCSKNEKNIKACLFNMDFPQEFWKEEQKKADRFASLVAHTPEITNRIKNWPNTTLDEKKEVIFKATEIFKYVYGDAPEVKFFTPEQERARLVQQGLSEDTHIEAAYALGKTINFNEERLQTSDNFFAVSVMFHEGTHFRQHTENFNNPLVDRILKSTLNRLNKYDDIINKKMICRTKIFTPCFRAKSTLTAYKSIWKVN